jgi:D-threo-aldose 1-dehydrogenase
MRSAEEAQRNVESFAVDVPAQVWTDLRAAGLIR